MKRTDVFQEEPIDKTIDHLEEEARMVLPGIQALFGFQLIAVFNQRFTELNELAKNFHLISLLCTTISILCVLTPAAYHRQVEPTSISTYLCRIGSRLLTFSMLPLAIGISLDLDVIGSLVLKSESQPHVIASLALLSFLTAWFLFPLYKRRDKKRKC